MGNCPICGTELVWGCDYDAEDCGIERAGLLSTDTCPNEDCEAEIEIFVPEKPEE